MLDMCIVSPNDSREVVTMPGGLITFGVAYQVEYRSIRLIRKDTLWPMAGKHVRSNGPAI